MTRTKNNFDYKLEELGLDKGLKEWLIAFYDRHYYLEERHTALLASLNTLQHRTDDKIEEIVGFLDTLLETNPEIADRIYKDLGKKASQQALYDIQNPGTTLTDNKVK